MADRFDEMARAYLKICGAVLDAERAFADYDKAVGG